MSFDHPLSQLDPRVRRTRADVVAAAGRMLLEEGWDAVTHARVAARAGYSRATLYRHWGAHADLIELALEHVNGMPHSTPTGDVAADLVAELDAFRAFLTSGGFGTVLAALAHHAVGDERMAGLRDEAVARSLTLVRELVEKAQAEGLLSGSLDADAAVAMLAGGVIHTVTVGRPPADGRAFAERCVAAVLRG